MNYMNQLAIQKLKPQIYSYNPTAWMFSTYIKCVMAQAGAKESLSMYARKIFELADGEKIALDFYPKNLFDSEEQAKKPITIYFSGLTGSSMHRQGQIFAKMNYEKTGENTLVFNRRGFSGMKFTRDKIFTWDFHDDLEEVIDYLLDVVGFSHVNLVGICMGANYALKYVGKKGEKGEDSRVNAVCSISSAYDMTAAYEKISKNPLIEFSLSRDLKNSLLGHEEDPHFLNVLKKSGVDLGKAL